MSSDDRPNGPFAASWFSSAAGNFSGAFLVIALFATYWFFQVAPLIDSRGTDIPGFNSHQNDFKHLYIGARLLGQDLSPYKAENVLMLAGGYSQTMDPRFRSILPYVYLPFTGLVLYPVVALPFAKAALLFQAINHLALLLALLMVAAACRWRENGWNAAVLLAMVAVNISVYRQNNAGQLNALLLFGFALLFVAMQRRWHDSLIGFIAAFLMLLKLSPGIFLFYFLFKRQWSRAGWMVAMAAGMTLVSVAAFGLDRHLEFLPVLSQMGYGKSTWAEFGHTFWRDGYNQSVNALLHRLFVEFPDSGITPWASLGPAVANVGTWIFSLAVLALMAWRLWRNGPGGNLHAEFSLAVAASLLLPSIMWDHYLVQILVPVVLLSTIAGWERRAWLAQAALLLSVALICWPVALDAENLRSGPALLLMNLKLLPVLLCGAIAWFHAGAECIEPTQSGPARSTPSDARPMGSR